MRLSLFLTDSSHYFGEAVDIFSLSLTTSAPSPHFSLFSPMARKKIQKPSSTAARFRDLEDKVNPTVNYEVDVEPQTPEEPYDMENPDHQPFPFNYIYKIQDFLNDELTYAKTIQLLGLAYLCQVFYNSMNQPWEFWEKIAMNYTGVAIGMIISYRLSYQKFQQGLIEEPALPEFNLLYPVLLSNIMAVKYDFYVIENLALNYFTMINIPVVARGFSGVVFFVLYGNIEKFSLFVSMLLVYTVIFYLLDYINKGQDEHVISKEVMDQDVDLELVKVEDNVVKSGLNASLSLSEIHLILVILVNMFYHLNGDVEMVIMQKLLIGLVGAFMVSWPPFMFNQYAGVAVFSGAFYYLVNRQLEPILGNSIAYLIKEIQQNMELFSIWSGILIFNTIIVFNINMEFNLRRKIWHFMVLVTAMPSLVVAHQFTKLALLGLMVIFIMVEAIRLNKILFLGQFIYDKLYRFQDFKDLKGPLNVSYIYLLFGIISPVVLDDFIGKSNKKFIGLIFLGLGDSVASIIGKAWGKHKFKGTNKTIEGSIGFIITSFLGYMAIDHYLGYETNHEILFIVCLIGGLFEGCLSMNDNLILSLIIFVLWDVLEYFQ